MDIYLYHGNDNNLSYKTIKIIHTSLNLYISILSKNVHI